MRFVLGHLQTERLLYIAIQINQNLLFIFFSPPLPVSSPDQ